MSGYLVTVNVKAPAPITKSQVLISVACSYSDGTEGGADTGGWIPASDPITSLQFRVEHPGKCEVLVVVQQLGQVVPVLCPIEDARFEIKAFQVTPGVQNVQVPSSSSATLQVVAPKIGCADMSYIIRARPADPKAQAVVLNYNPSKGGSTATLAGLSPGTQYSLTISGACSIDKSETPESTPAIFSTPCDAGLHYNPNPVGGKCVCAAGYQLLNGGCVQSQACPIGQFRDPTANICKQCSGVANCATVTCQSYNNSTCSTCNSGYSLDQSTGQCSTACGPGQYIDSQSKCAPCTAVAGCSASSALCSSTTDSKCFKCDGGYYLNNNGICTSCVPPAGCISSGLTCTSSSESGTTCSGCALGYYLLNGKCVACSPVVGCTLPDCTAAGSKCKACDGTANFNTSPSADGLTCKCKDGYYSNGGLCAQCTAVPNCSGITTCLGPTDSKCAGPCTTGFTLQANGQCLSQATPTGPSPGAPLPPSLNGDSVGSLGYAPLGAVQCNQCLPDNPDLCELIYAPAPCNDPNNRFCITYMQNAADGSRVVQRGCGSFNRCVTEWYQGTSDNDKCRDVNDHTLALDFTCTFCCYGTDWSWTNFQNTYSQKGAPNCNNNIRPEEPYLYQPT